jgi:hypothetical protein
VSPWWKPATARLEPAPDWRGALAALEARFAARAPRRLRVVLSNHYARFLMLPWDETLARPAERRAYLEHHFSQVYGGRVAEWSFAVDRFGRGAQRLAAAVDRALVDALRQLAAKRRFALAGAQPLLIDAFNRERRAAQETVFFFAVLEPGRATLLLVRDGAPERVASRRCTDASAELERMVAAETTAAGLERPPPVRLAAEAA